MCPKECTQWMFTELHLNCFGLARLFLSHNLGGGKSSSEFSPTLHKCPQRAVPVHFPFAGLLCFALSAAASFSGPGLIQQQGRAATPPLTSSKTWANRSRVSKPTSFFKEPAGPWSLWGCCYCCCSGPTSQRRKEQNSHWDFCSIWRFI